MVIINDELNKSVYFTDDADLMVFISYIKSSINLIIF